MLNLNAVSLFKQILKDHHSLAKYQVIHQQISEGGNMTRSRRNIEMVKTYLLENLDQITPQLIESYFEANEQASFIEEVYGVFPDFIYLSEEKFNEIFKHYQEGWDIFNARYPDTNCILDISAPGFSEDGLNALIYLGKKWDVLGGIGNYYIYTFINEQWQYKDQVMGWIS